MYYGRILCISLLQLFFHFPNYATNNEKIPDTPTIVSSQKHWQEVTTVKAVMEHYPERLSYLFSELDLSLPDLQAVKKQIENDIY